MQPPVNRRGSTEPKDTVGSPARHPREYSTLPGGKNLRAAGELRLFV